MRLSKDQTQQVRAYLLRNGIESRLVFDDLLDHICCLVEERMEAGQTFDVSLQQACERFPGQKLKNIELFTLKLLQMETSFSTKTSLLATIPFGMFGLVWALDMGRNVPYSIVSITFLAAVVGMYGLLWLGWVKNFPRWSFPAVGFCLLFSLYLSYIRIPSVSDEELGVWAWWPLLITIVLGLLFNRSLQPLKELMKKVKDDFTLILFTLYGFAPLFVSFFTDEIHSLQMLPYILLSSLLLGGGLYGFLKCKKKKRRVVSLLLSGSLAVCVIGVSGYMFWS